MAPHPSKHGRCTRQLVFFLLLSSSLAAVAPASYSSHCSSSSSPAAPDRHANDVSKDADLLSSFGMGKGNQQQEVSASSIWRRMDRERIVTVASTMLLCVFTVVLWRQLRNHEETPAMSMAMHVVIIFLVCVALEFIVSHWVFFLVTFVYMFS